jgi:hypothetical protein
LTWLGGIWIQLYILHGHDLQMETFTFILMQLFLSTLATVGHAAVVSTIDGV